MTRINMNTGLSASLSVLVLLGFSAVARAAYVKLETVMSPKEQIQLNFADESGHFVLMVRREGRATGEGLLA
jgi:hypothetical protein